MKRFKSFNSVLALALMIAFAFSSAIQAEEVVTTYPYMGSTEWSPNGKYIAFNSNGYIHVLDLDTGEIKNVTEGLPDIYNKYEDSNGQWDLGACFSADSKEVFYARENARWPGKPDFHVMNIRAVNIETGEWRTIREDGYRCSLSQDNRYLYYAQKEKYNTIYDMETGELKVFDFTDNSKVPNNWYGFAFFGSIHPDNSHFLLSLYGLDHVAQLTELNKQRQIYKVDIETGATELVPLPEGINYRNATYSDDGSKIIVWTCDYYPAPSTTRDPDTYAIYEEVYNEMELYYHSWNEPYNSYTGHLVRIETYEEYMKMRDLTSIWQKTEGFHGGYMSLENFINRPTEIRPRSMDGTGIYDIATGDYHQIDAGEYYSARSGSFSPDGSQVAYILRNENDGFCVMYIYDIATGTHKAVASTYEVEGPTAVDNEAAPASFAITGNFPNPFNPTTTIEFSLEKAGDVSLDIYNVMGQHVRSLESNVMAPGAHAVVWNGRDDSGNAVSSGVYISRLRMGEAVQSKAMLLAK